MRHISAHQARLFEILDSCVSRLSEKEAMQAIGVSRDTWKRYRNGQNMPLAALRLLEIHLTGKPPEMGQEWAGFCFAQGKLYTPANHGITPGDILALPILQAQARELRLLTDQSTVIQYRLL